MKTYTGSDAPLPDNHHQPNPIDIVVHLGRTGRFGGWGVKEWTVLHHSMLCSLLWLRAFGPEGVHHALLHDAHEYITGDIPSPVKAQMSGFAALESNLDRRIYAMLGVSTPDLGDYDKVKLVDAAALIIEARYFGTPGSFDLITKEAWGKTVGKTLDQRLAIIDIIKKVFPDLALGLRAITLSSPTDQP